METIPIVATVHAQAGIADFQENREALKQNFRLRGYIKKRGYQDSAELAKNQIPQLARWHAANDVRLRSEKFVRQD